MPLFAGVAVGAGAGGGGDGTEPATRRRAKQAAPAKPPELPLGGRQIFPNFRVVAFYGAPQNHELGALGIGTPDARRAGGCASRRSRTRARPAR